MNLQWPEPFHHFDLIPRSPNESEGVSKDGRESNPPPWFETARWRAPPHHEAEREITVFDAVRPAVAIAAVLSGHNSFHHFDLILRSPSESEGVSKDGRESEPAAMVRDGALARASSP